MTLPSDMVLWDLERSLDRQLDALGLSDWDVRVSIVDGLLPSHYACIDYRDIERVAQIRIDKAVVELNDIPFLERCLYHEVMHLVLHKYENLVGMALASVPEGKREILNEFLEDELEIAVESLTSLLIPGNRYIAVDEEERKNWPAFAKGSRG